MSSYVLAREDGAETDFILASSPECHERHIKCRGGTPCEPCQRFGRNCSKNYGPIFVEAKTVAGFNDLRSAVKSSFNSHHRSNPITKLPEVQRAVYSRLHVRDQLRLYYLTSVAPWLDTPDPLRHFSTTIPTLAQSCHALSLAVLALAAAHAEGADDVDPQDFVIVGQGFQRACSRELDPYPSGDEPLEPDVLSAVVLLRLAVQMSRSPSMTSETLPSLQTFADAWKTSPSSALHGALFLTALQSDIRIAWRHHQPVPRLEIGVCLMKHVCTYIEDPRIWYARTVMLVAQALRHCYGGPEERTLDNWLQIDVSSESWSELLPRSFDAMVCEDAFGSTPFGKLVYREGVHASAQVHYMLARLLMINHAPSTIRKWASETSRKLETSRLVRQIYATAEGHRDDPSVVLVSSLLVDQTVASLSQDYTESDDVLRTGADEGCQAAWL
ncbi:hypothetical protein LTR95_002966 [Oleoguttula sp. CCFEE 5521]